MAAKEESKPTEPRVSVTQRPGTGDLLDEMNAATKMSKNDLFNIGIDVLHFIWSVMAKGGTIGVKFPDDDTFRPVNIFIPGMTKPSLKSD
ncbi:hypothetical protein [Nocardia gipuzkoensis]